MLTRKSFFATLFAPFLARFAGKIITVRKPCRFYVAPTLPLYPIPDGTYNISIRYVDSFGNDALAYDPTIKPGDGWAVSEMTAEEFRRRYPS